MTNAPALPRDAVAYPALIAGLALLAAALGVASVAIGYGGFALGPALADVVAGRETLPALVLVELRLPRALLGLLVGASLGLAGAALQGLLRNPLADPGVVGVSGGAALGAVVAFYSGLAGLAPIALPAGGLAGAAVATALLVLIGRGAGTTGLILAGVAIGSLAGALTALALNLAPNPYAVYEILFWLMGSLADRSLEHVALALPFMAVGAALMLSGAPALDALTLGEDTLASLGFSPGRLRWTVIGGVAAAVGAAVSVSGAIGFVGLVVPHLVRPLVGHRPGRLLVASALGGAAMLTAADIAVRLIPTAPELKLGVVTALVGAPFLLALLVRLRRLER